MAPLNPNSTARLKIFYQNAIAEHTAVIRFGGAGGLADAETSFLNLVGVLTSQFAFNEVTAVQQAVALSDVFNDIPGSPLVGATWGASPATRENNPVALTFVGRTTGGRRSRFSLFAFSGPTSAYRLTSAESSSVANALDILDATAGSFLAIDSLSPIWKRYADIKAFDHWVGESRSG